ncbi:MAG: hypothetical protein Fur0037_02320 [Planctomycetota bacterium]
MRAIARGVWFLAAIGCAGGARADRATGSVATPDGGERWAAEAVVGGSEVRIRVLAPGGSALRRDALRLENGAALLECTLICPRRPSRQERVPAEHSVRLEDLRESGVLRVSIAIEEEGVNYFVAPAHKRVLEVALP